MYCDNCGCEIQPGMTICPVCGKVFNGDYVAMPGDGSHIPMPDNIAPVFQNQHIIPENNNPYIQEDNYFSDDDEEGTSILTSYDSMMANDDDEEGTSILTSYDSMMTNDDDEGTSILAGPMNVEPGRIPTGPNGMASNGMPIGPNGMAPNGMPVGPNGMMPNGIPAEVKNKKQDKELKEAEKTAKKSEKKDKNSVNKNKSGKNTGKAVGIVIGAAVIIAVAGVGAVFVPKYLNYDKAKTALQNGEIENALDYYSKCGSYKDAQTKVNGGAYFEYATSLEESQDYVNAAENYRKAAGLSYEGAADKEKECYFNQGEKLYGEGEYTEAATYYKQADTYNGAVEKVKECSYKNGCQLMESSDYEGAIEAFATAEDYEDSAEKIKECYYNEAQALMDVGDYEAANTAFLKSEYSDYIDKSNECLLNLAAAYSDQENYEKAIATYEQVDANYKDCTKKINTCHKKWGNKLYDEKDYKGAVEQYELVTSDDMTKKIHKAKAAYIKDHFDSSDATTIGYLCDLKYDEYGSAEDDYKTLTGWSVKSFINSKETDYTTKKNSLKANKTIYIHSMFNTDGDATLNLYGYIVYSNGTKSTEVTFGQIENNFTTWASIAPENAIVGDATIYIYDRTSGNLIEKYTFKIKES